MKRSAVSLLAILLAGGAALAADTIAGPAKAIDSGIITIGEKRVMLYGVDSVERKQTCGLNNKEWKCWDAAVAALNAMVAAGPVSCNVVGSPDVYGRVLGTCTVSGKNLNEAYVRAGWGVARTTETKDYVAAQTAAKADKAGLWQGEFQMPPDFRASHGIFVDRP